MPPNLTAVPDSQESPVPVWPPVDLNDLIARTSNWPADANGVLTRQQVEYLLRPLNEKRVEQVEGGSRASYLPTWDVEATLNKVFGYGGWDRVVQHVELVYERGTERDKEKWQGSRAQNNLRKVPVTDSTGAVIRETVWQVGYRATVQLIVRDLLGRHVAIKGDVAMGLASGQADLGESHDLALKTAVSTALKRCAKALGDQFGLSLYDGGSVEPKVQWTLAAPPIRRDSNAPAQLDGQSADSPA